MEHTLGAIEALDKIREGLISSVELVKACLARIEETEGQLKAWAHLDAEYAIKQAEEMDAIRQTGRPMGALHGIPVGLKDIIDTRDYPTERGSPVFSGRKPDTDAAIVERLREAGAVILGKTVTTEFAFMHPNETRNPHNIEHSPGGSSSGSAAAVAAYNVPLAIGTQTNGSVIRPASYCGVFGFKPTRGVVSRRGILQTSKSLDQVGVFARNLEDAALLADVISGYDASDPLSYPRPRPQMLAGAQDEPPVEPVFAWFDLPYADRLSADTCDGMDEVVEVLGNQVEKLPSPNAFANLIDVQRIIHEYEICQHLEDVFANHWDKISSTLKPTIERGRKISRDEYQDACGTMEAANEFFAVFFNDFDAVIAPAATGEAPLFCNGTGDPVCSTIWTLSGLPAISLPVLAGENGLPIGLQLVGAVEEDDRLLRTANWVLNQLRADA